MEHKLHKGTQLVSSGIIELLATSRDMFVYSYRSFKKIAAQKKNNNLLFTNEKWN